MENKSLSKIFLLTLLVTVLIGCFLVFRPFLTEIIAAAILASIFYHPYEVLTKRMGGRNKLAAAATCVLIALLVIIPLVNFLIFAGQKSVDAYTSVADFVSQASTNSIDSPLFNRAYGWIVQNGSIKDTLLEMAGRLNGWLVAGAGEFIKGTTNFFISLALIIFSMFFFFVDGEKMVAKLMQWTPLSSKYDQAIFKKFRDVSLYTMLSTLVTALAQGIVASIGFFIAGVPAFFFGIAVAFFSLLPYIGSGLIWFPTAIYLLIVGKIWQGVFLLAWGGFIISTVDNLIRAYIIHGKSHVHPLFIIFSILGGISLFGFWGIVFGPLIISLAVTILHIYEQEYKTELEK